MFEGVKRLTLPDQCMSLKEMLRRFIHRETLPAAKDGIYVETEYDLEKLAKMDRVEQDEVLDVMKRDVASKKKAIDDDSAARQKVIDDAAAKLVVPPIQTDPKDSSPKQP